jgi:mannose-1-phosphate guanylyltransferase
MMQAVLLAAGFGTRLGELTQNTPKCLIEVGGRPMLDHWLSKLFEVGVDHVFVNTHYLAERVESFLRESRYADRLETVFEERLLGTAGTIGSLRSRLTADEVLVAHADNYFTDSLHGLVDAHRSRPAEAIMTMGMFESATPQSCGIVELDTRQIVVGFEEKPQHPRTNLANAAVYVFSQAGLDEVESATDLSTQVLPKLVGKMRGHRFTGSYFDVGTPQALSEARKVASVRD